MRDIPLWEQYTLTVEEAALISVLAKTSCAGLSPIIETRTTFYGMGIAPRSNGFSLNT